MSELIARIRHDFPTYDAIETFEAAIPAYAIRLVLEVLHQQELTIFQRYILELLSLEVKSLSMLAYYLGVDQNMLKSSVAALLKNRYVEQRAPIQEQAEYEIVLTPEGRKAIDKQGPLPVPTRRTGRFLFNALTETPVSSSEDALYPDQVDKQGLFVLPPKETERPTLATFVGNEKDVTAVLEDEFAFRDTVIVNFLKLQYPAMRYFAPATVVVLQHRETQVRTVAVYRGDVQQRPETEALQRLLDAKKFQIPATSTPITAHEQEIYIPTKTLSSTVVQEIQRVVEGEQQREEIVIQVEEQRILKTATQDARERKVLEEKIQELQHQLDDKEKDIQLLRKQLRQSNVEFLRTEQHREKLLQAISEAKQEVIIISSWITPAACDEQFCKLFAEALIRHVRIRIGYGTERENDPRDEERNRHNVEEVKRMIRKRLHILKAPSSIPFQDDIVKITGPHQNILVCDRTFAITGSFNWLSYNDQQDQGYRQEVGVVFRQQDPVNEIAEIALRSWNAKKKE